MSGISHFDLFNKQKPTIFFRILIGNVNEKLKDNISNNCRIKWDTRTYK